jgi:uncharacterized protein (DUF1684 family)
MPPASEPGIPRHSERSLMMFKTGKIRILTYALPLVGIFFLTACSGRLRDTQPVSADPLQRERREKDIAFKTGRDSPIPKADQARFTGLAYFDINPALRFRVKLNRYLNPVRVRLGTNTGEIHSALRYGHFAFEVRGISCQLQVYRVEDVPENAGSPYLFVPFRDATTGKETYGAGRYIDLKENTSGIYDLDFNRAYNPSCAYGKGYSCPIPPPENTIPVPIEAGEKKYLLAEEQ